MKQMICEICGSNAFLKKEGEWVCQECGAKYTTEEAKRLLVEEEEKAAPAKPVKVKPELSPEEKATRKKRRKRMAVIFFVAAVVVLILSVTILTVKNYFDTTAIMYSDSDRIEGEKIKRIIIKEGVTTISFDTFFSCDNLETISIPESVKSIDNGAIIWREKLKTIKVKKENPYYHTSQNCLIETQSKTLIWGNQKSKIPTDGSVTKIGNDAFRNCKKLKTISIPDCVTHIGEAAFNDCENLKSITIGKGVDSIGDGRGFGVFTNCNKLNEVNISDLEKWCNISFGMFIDNPLYYAHNLYLNGKIITDLILPEKIVNIKESTFCGCTCFTSVKIPDSVTSIGDRAFSGCTGLTSVTIPNSVTSIGNSAFYNCTGLTSVTIPDSVTSIESAAFLNCTGLTSITIPDSVTSIGLGAFYGCTGLTSVTIPNSVTSIGRNAFFGCIDLKYTEHENGCYLGNNSNPYLALIKVKDTSATFIHVYESTKIIADEAFHGCTDLTSVTIPDSVTSIGLGAFYGCTGLTNMTVASGNPTYHSDGNCIIETASKTLVAGCKNGVIPTNGSVMSIGISAFYGCTGLTSVTIPDSVTSIGINAFYGCTGLTSITYTGTKAQWNVIEKESGWDEQTGTYTVHCTDGDIVK